LTFGGSVASLPQSSGGSWRGRRQGSNSATPRIIGVTKDCHAAASSWLLNFAKTSPPEWCHSEQRVGSQLNRSWNCGVERANRLNVLAPEAVFADDTAAFDRCAVAARRYEFGRTQRAIEWSTIDHDLLWTLKCRISTKFPDRLRQYLPRKCAARPITVGRKAPPLSGPRLLTSAQRAY
jgi:hypothetical protein